MKLPWPAFPLIAALFCLEPATPTAVQAGATQKLKNITFDTIKFNIVKKQKFKRAMLTPEIEALKGQRVRVRGYILNAYQQSGITSFVLVRDDQECCFGPEAMIYDCILVKMEPGKSIDFSVTPITLDGRFDIEPREDDDGNLIVLYHITGEAVK